MKDQYKTKKELICELEELRRVSAAKGVKCNPDWIESELSEKKNFYKDFYEFSPIIYFTVDGEGTILTVNPTGADKLGYDREELIGESVLKVFYEEDKDKVLSQLKTCFKNPGRVHSWELRKVKKDGTIIWVKQTARTVKDLNNRAFTTIVCEDITDHKQAELLLATEKKVFELIARNASLNDTLNSLCLEVESQTNGMLCSFLLLDENGLNLRHGAAPSLPKNYIKATDGVEIGPMVGSCGTASYLKKPVVVSNIETDPLWQDYKEIALKYGLKSCWSSPIISSDKRVLGTFAMYYKETRSPNILEKKIIETTTFLAKLAIEKLRSHELASQLGEILEGSLNEIYIFDAQTRKFIQVNKGARKNLGYTFEELKNMTPLEIKSDLSNKDFDKLIRPLLSGKEEEITFQTTHRRKDGSKYPVRVYLQVSEFKGKKVFIANIIDITEQNEREQELKSNLEQLSKKNRYEEIISTVTQSVHSSVDLQEVMDNAVEAMNKNIDGADNVSIYFIEGDDAAMKASVGYADWFIKKVKRIPKPKGFTWKVLGEGKQIYCPDVEKDNVIGKAGKKVGTKSYASMPIKHGDETIACININSFKKNAFDDGDLKLLDIIANQIAIAIDNARQTNALRESEERYRTLYDQSPIGVFIFNTDLVIINTNDRHAEIIKSTREKIIGTDLRKLKDQTFTRLQEDTLKGKSGCQEGFYSATSSSAELWIFVSTAPLRDGAGKIIGGMSVVEDITERKNAEIALRQSEEDYESLVNNVEGIVWEADPKTLTFTFISKQAERILGYPSKNWIEDTEFWLNHLHPEDRDWVPAKCLTATQEKKDHVLEYRMIAADGITVWLRDIVTVIVEQGEVVWLRGLMVDVTDLKKAENLLKERAEQYRALVEKVHDVIVESSSDGKFLYVSPNSKEVAGYEQEELEDVSIFKYVHPDDKGHTFKEFARIITEQTSGKAVFRFQHKNGSWIWFDSTGNTYQTAEGEIRCVIVSRDITESKKLEEELFKKQNLESLGILAGGIAHDFNNLLTSILGNISISKMHLNPKDKIRARLIEAENASLRAKDLTSQLLTFSKGGAPVKEYVHSLGDLIRDTANFAVSGSQIKCEFDFEDKIWPAEIDMGQISQVIHNLVINADQATPEGGKINIKLQNASMNGSNDFNIKEGNYIKITIEDKGIGMTEELKKKIFDPYFTTKQKGSGLGLSTVYSIVKNHDGHINVNSEIGEGTGFEIYIPAAEETASIPKITSHAPKGEGKILVMDDEESVRKIAGEMIKYLGYAVEYATDGNEAIEKYVSAKQSGCPFDVVMIDLTVAGGMGGKEANQRLLDIDPQVRTIVSSGYSNDPVMSEYNKFGFKGMITKPYKIDELSSAIHGVLNSSQ